ncbi:Peptidase family S41 [Streptoalloteichus tenebrarius]|uniref:Peptidase family S41 n=1 Tax=Streptoalloteichus tenebrarius (strain ATCC 17920 / DSM 40477 / JCM 4838 / CBS 697.72 / NBRC 16177 / NCIMB 11028 / NRRL B-12390 / A12253. 1 / ISP 5477) TaxID=1933 RepID=A0ABT1I2J8_STRSD|nr:S41 family peptidase [Streptoalloteichus tenebrarius]MCP2262012.1 Peptidase family S41 [Streptoalloteichus tenebrarius]BFF02134.1 hypothetical protein GCM10020241_38090 [Streptoalloteichus tenebrarius]
MRAGRSSSPRWPCSRTPTPWSSTSGSTAAGIPARVALLSSFLTFSATEEFTYDRQRRKRAAVVGERTRGGAPTPDIEVPADEALGTACRLAWEHVLTLATPDADGPHAALAEEDRQALHRP